MSSIGAFVLDCVASGRWRRGLLALQSSSTSTNRTLRHASVALAVVTAPHNWQAALTLLHPRDVYEETALTCGVVASLPRCPGLTTAQEAQIIRSLLHGAESLHAFPPTVPPASAAPVRDSMSATPPSQTTVKNTTKHMRQAQSWVLLQALRWCSEETAASLAQAFPPLVQAVPTRTLGTTPQRTMTVGTQCATRLAALRSLRRDADDVYACLPFDELSSSRQEPQPPRVQRDGRRAREQARIVAQRVAAENAAHAQEEHAALLAALQSRAQSAVAVPFGGRPAPDDATSAVLNAEALRYPAATELGVLLNRASQVFRVRDAREPTVSQRSPTHPHASSFAPPPAAPLPPSLSVSWQLALSLTHASPVLTSELFPLYVRCVGLRAPHMWATALSHAAAYWSRQTTGASPPLEEACLTLWMTSRGNWCAAVQFYQSTLPTRSLAASRVSASPASIWRAYAEDCLARTATPISVFVHLFPARPDSHGRDGEAATGDGSATAATAHRRPSFRLSAPTRRHIARALATGLRLEEIQLSAVARRWKSGGHWQELLWLYERLPTEEFQRYLVQSLVEGFTKNATDTVPSDQISPALAPHARTPGRPVSSSAVVDILTQVGASQHRRRRGRVPAPGTHCCWLLIRASRDAREAVRVFRCCVQLGTLCKPQLLSGLMDAGVRRNDLEDILRHYSGAVNDGVRRRATEEFGITLR